MKSQFSDKICIFFVSIICIYALSLFINVSSTFAWATGVGCIYYNGQRLNGVNVKEGTSGEIRTSGSAGEGCYSFDRIDCGVSPSYKVIHILGWGSGSPPPGIPAGGSFIPSSFTMGEFGNGQVFSLYQVNYVPPPPPPPPPTAIPIPTPTPVACGGPCTANTQCGLACPICANGTCVVPTPTLVPCGGPCTANTQCGLACPICAGGSCLAPSPTPTPTPDCKCDGLSVQGSFFSGTKVEIQGFAKVKNPDTNSAEVLSMVYDLYKDSVKVASSGEVKVAGNPERITNNEGVADRYNSLWAFSIPGTGMYKLSETINCGWKSDNVKGIQSSNNSVVTNTPIVTKKPTAELNPLSFFFSWIGGYLNPSKNLSPQAIVPTLTPTPTPFVPATSKSIKIQAINPELDIKCTEATFKVDL